MISKQTVFLNSDRTKAVAEGDKDAKFLLVREGHEIDEAQVEKYDAAGIVGSGKRAKSESAEPSPVNRESALPSLHKRGKK